MIEQDNIGANFEVRPNYNNAKSASKACRGFTGRGSASEKPITEDSARGWDGTGKDLLACMASGVRGGGDGMSVSICSSELRNCSF